MADFQNNNSQYNIPQNIYTTNSYEAEQAALISAKLEAEHVRQVADFSARLEARQHAMEAAITEARNAAMAAYAQHEPQARPEPVIQQAQPQPQPIASMAYYRDRKEQHRFNAPNYGIKEVENVLESARKAQLAIDEDKNPIEKAAAMVKSLFLEPVPLLDAYKDEEKIVGGDLVTKVYNEQGVNPAGQMRFFCDDHDWYLYIEGQYDAAVHYEVTDDEIKKFQFGHRVQMLPGEEEALRMLAPRYLKAVIEKLYPIDAMITELMSPEEPKVDYIQRAA